MHDPIGGIALKRRIILALLVAAVVRLAPDRTGPLVRENGKRIARHCTLDDVTPWGPRERLLAMGDRVTTLGDLSRLGEPQGEPAASWRPAATGTAQ